MPDTYNMSDVFISYSRRDAEFVKKLFDDIKAREKEVWADFEDIPKAADWWKEIQAGIDAADSFVFVISPDSVNSDICRQEIDHAVASNKRFLPIVFRDIVTPEDKEKVHHAISSHNWIFFREGDDYTASFDTLMTSIDTDLDHNRNLTRLLVRAKEWQDSQNANSYLLQGEDLNNAEAWLAEGMNKKPTPTNLHAEYIRASRQAQIRSQRTRTLIFAGGFVVSLLLALFALLQTYQAEIARDQAVDSQNRARSIALASNANEALANNNPDLALVLAGAAVIREDERQIPQVYSSLTAAAYAPATRLRVETENIVKTAVYAPDGQSFAAGYIDGKICTYQSQSGEMIACLNSPSLDKAHDGEVLWIHMSADASRLLSSGADGRLLLWDISGDTASIINELSLEGLKSSSLASTGDFAIFGLADGRLGYWDLQSAEPEYFEQGHGAAVNVIALNSDNSLLLSGSEDASMILWDVATRAWKNEFFNPDNTAAIVSVAFSPDSTIGVSGDVAAVLSVWNLDLGTLIRTLQGHNESVTAISFAADGRTIFTASWDNSIREWDMASGREVTAYHGHNGGINALSLSADSLNMVSGGFDNSLRLWHVRPPIFVSQFLTNGFPINSVDWNGAVIVTAEGNGSILVLNRETGEVLQDFEREDGTEAIFVRLSPSGREAFAVFRNCDAIMVNVNGQILWTKSFSELAGERCRFVQFRPTGQEVLLGTERRLLRLDARTGDEIAVIPYHLERTPQFRSAMFTPDGTQLAVGENYPEANLYIIDVETGEIVRQLDGHSDGVLAMDFNADGTKLATGSFDNDVRIWDLLSDDRIVLEGHSDRLVSVEFSTDGNYLISSSNDRTVRLWNLQTNYTVYTYRGHTNRVVRATFSPDGRHVLTGSFDTTLIVWNFPQRLDELAVWVCQNRYIRELSQAEQEVYLDDDQNAAKNACP